MLSIRTSLNFLSFGRVKPAYFLYNTVPYCMYDMRGNKYLVGFNKTFYWYCTKDGKIKACACPVGKVFSFFKRTCVCQAEGTCFISMVISLAASFVINRFKKKKSLYFFLLSNTIYDWLNSERFIQSEVALKSQ